MNTDIAKIKDAVISARTEAELVAVRCELENAIHFLKSLKEEKLDPAILEYMDNNGIREIQIDECYKLIKTVKKTDRYATEAIFKELAFSQEQIDILPKNPAFRKTAVLANNKICHCHYEDEEDKIIVKEINLAMLKRMGKIK